MFLPKLVWLVDVATGLVIVSTIYKPTNAIVYFYCKLPESSLKFDDVFGVFPGHKNQY